MQSERQVDDLKSKTGRSRVDRDILLKMFRFERGPGWGTSYRLDLLEKDSGTVAVICNEI